MLRKKIDTANAELEELRNKDESFETRSSELETAITEAKTDEEMRTVEEEIDTLEEEKKEHEDAKRKLEDKIEEIEEELRELNKKAPKNKEERGNKMDKTETRQAINQYVRSKSISQVRDMEGFKVVDGGALVPEELLPAEKAPEDVINLKSLVNVRKANRGSGSYPIIKKSGSKMVSVEELEKNPELAKPTLEDVDYKIETYRGYIPVSQEVIDDADYDIVGLIADEIADQELNTTNEAIIEVLKGAPAKTVTGLDGLKTLFNVDIKKVYNSKAIISASLYNELDTMKDNNGRYLLQDDITSSSGKKILGKEVIVLDDEMIGENEGDLVGFVGDAKAFATFFDRKQASVKWTDHDIYGQLLAGYVRFDVVKTDEDAGYYVTFEPQDIDAP